MATQFDNIFTKMAMIGLFIFCLISFIVFVQSDNNALDKLIDNSLINKTYGSLGNDLNTMRNSSQQQLTLFQKENPTGGFGTILLFSIVSVGKTFMNMITGVFNITINLPVAVLGVDKAVVGVLSSILVLTLIIGAWILYKLGG